MNLFLAVTEFMESMWVRLMNFSKRILIGETEGPVAPISRIGIFTFSQKWFLEVLE